MNAMATNGKSLDLLNWKKLTPSEMKQWATETIAKLVEIRNPVTTWQSNLHLPQRRIMIQRLMLLMQHRKGLLVPPQTWSEKVPGLVRRIELSLYIRAASLKEYMNVHTLKRRVQCLVITLHRQGLYYKSSNTLATDAKNNEELEGLKQRFHQSNVMPTIAIKRKIDARIINAEHSVHNEEPKRCRRQLSQYRHKNLSASTIFLGYQDDVVCRVFSFLDGIEVVRKMSISRYFRKLLPACVIYLRIELTMLQHLLRGSIPGGALASFRYLQELEIFNRNSILACHQFPVNPLMADGCPQLPFSCTNEGEEIIRDLAVGLMARSNPHLRVLSLCSNFVNTSHINSIAAIACALKSGCCPKLEVFRLGGNSIGDGGALEVADLLLSRSCPKLRHLDLRKNFIGESGIAGIANAIATGCCANLAVLCLGGNIIADCGAIKLSQCLSHGKAVSLAFLGLEHNFIEDNGITALARVLKTLSCPSLKELRLGDNAISNSRIQTIFSQIMSS